MKIALLSDIHSAAAHFRSALEDARHEGFDQLVILGDLLTYGPEPVETLEIAHQAVALDGALVITGNHDVLYLGGPEAKSYHSRLPDWIRESVEWTSAQLGDGPSIADLPWQPDWQLDDLYVAHANPFGFGDWTYLRDNESFSAALSAVRARSCRWGVFGHVHRFRQLSADDGQSAIVTIGSLGQPRDKAEPGSQWAVVTAGAGFRVEQRRVAKDWNALVRKIEGTSMSPATKERLCQFYL
jgi:predicted phosphodiesterase